VGKRTPSNGEKRARAFASTRGPRASEQDISDLARPALKPGMLHGEPDQLGLPFDPKLALDIEPVRLHRAHRQNPARAICLLVRPLAMCRSTSFSRVVSWLSGNCGRASCFD
jgi:hypothetical protein